MDKKTFPLIFICILLIMFWGSIMDWIWPPKTPSSGNTNQLLNARLFVTNAPVVSPLLKESILQAVKSDIPKTVETATLENNQIQVTFTSLGGAIDSITLKKFSEKGEGLMTLNKGSPLPALATAMSPISFQSLYQLAVSSNQLRASYQSPNGIKVIKEYTLHSDYQITANVTFTNTTPIAFSNSTLQVALGMATPLNRRDNGQYMGVSLLSPEKTYHEMLPGLQKYIDKQKKPLEKIQKTDWAALKNQYFTLLTTPSASFASVQMEPYPLPPYQEPNSVKAPHGIVAMMNSSPFYLDPKASTNWTFEVYAGPKEYKKLAALGQHQDEILDFGFFGIFSKALLWLMDLFHTFSRNWGVAILLVTVAIKILFWPLTAISSKSMKQMQVLAPQMNALKEKYKNDSKKMNEEMMKMYREYKINPMAGCLPMLVQIPIFIAFYNLLLSAIELRGAPFILWIRDLSAPDTVARISGIDFPINPLPLIMAATMIWQTRITPQAPNADPSMKMMMWFMPAIFLFFCYNFSSGLSLYWTAQNLLSILQTYLTKDKPVEPPQRVKFKGGFTFSRPIHSKKK